MLSDRNQPSLIAVVAPNRNFVLKVANDLGILDFEDKNTSATEMLNLARGSGQKHSDYQSKVDGGDSFFKFLCRHKAINAAVFASITATAHIYSNNHSSSSSLSTGIAFTLS